MPSLSPSLSGPHIGHRQDYHEAFGRLAIQYRFFHSYLSQLAYERLLSATTFLHLLRLVFIAAKREVHVDGKRSAFIM